MLPVSVFMDLIDNEDDRQSFASFYEKYKDYSLNLALSILHDTSLAEDAVQDAFMYLAKNTWRITDYEEKSAKWFLSELIRDFSNNIIRKENGISKVPLEDIDIIVSEEEFLQTMEVSAVDDIKSAISQLQETDQSIIRLFYTYEYKTKEIAQMLKMSDANVRKRLQRARAVLKSALDKEGVYE